MSDTDTTRPVDHGVVFWAAVGIGVALMAWGTVAYLEEVADLSRRIDLAVWLVGADLAHDAVVAPLVLLAGVAVARFMPSWGRAPVQVGLMLSASALILAWLPLHDTGRVAENDTIQPLDYRSGLAWVLAVIWMPVVAWAASRWWAGRSAVASGER